MPQHFEPFQPPIPVEPALPPKTPKPEKLPPKEFKAVEPMIHAKPHLAPKGAVEPVPVKARRNRKTRRTAKAAKAPKIVHGAVSHKGSQPPIAHVEPIPPKASTPPM